MRILITFAQIFLLLFDSKLFMKNIQILVLFLIGSALVIAGVLFKISNEPKDRTSLFLIVGMTFEAVAAILLIFKIFTKKNNKDSFLDS